MRLVLGDGRRGLARDLCDDAAGPARHRYAPDRIFRRARNGGGARHRTRATCCGQRRGRARPRHAGREVESDRAAGHDGAGSDGRQIGGAAGHMVGIERHRAADQHHRALARQRSCTPRCAVDGASRHRLGFARRGGRQCRRGVDPRNGARAEGRRAAAARGHRAADRRRGTGAERGEAILCERPPAYARRADHQSGNPRRRRPRDDVRNRRQQRRRSAAAGGRGPPPGRHVAQRVRLQETAQFDRFHPGQGGGALRL